MSDDAPETTRWERVRWDCPEDDCDGRIWPIDSVDYSDHEELWNDTSRGVADESVVACDSCETVFDVRFDSRDGGEDRDAIRDEMRNATDPRRASDISDQAGVDFVSTQMILRELRDEGFVALDDDQGWYRDRDEMDE